MDPYDENFKRYWLAAFVPVKGPGTYKLEVFRDVLSEDLVIDSQGDYHYMVVFKAIPNDSLDQLRELFADNRDEVPTESVVPLLLTCPLPLISMDQLLPMQSDEIEVVVSSFTSPKGEEFLCPEKLTPKLMPNLEESDSYLRTVWPSLVSEAEERRRLGQTLIELREKERREMKGDLATPPPQEAAVPKRIEGPIERFFKIVLMIIAILFLLWWIGRGIPPEPEDPWPYR